jgi:hypothetical protein
VGGLGAYGKKSIIFIWKNFCNIIVTQM